jgi:peptide/nickel transport system substrate-binding protein
MRCSVYSPHRGRPATTLESGGEPMPRCRQPLLLSLTATLLVALSACGRQSGPAPPAAGDNARQTTPGAPKILVWAGLREPGTFQALIGLGPSGSPASEIENVAHNYLVVQTDQQDYVPQLAVEQPSVERGTWRINPGGSMDSTWKIHPNIRWHDGRPLTSADLLFTFGASIDTELPKSALGGLRFMESASAPDPLTFVIHWSTTYVKADRDYGLAPMPAHLLEGKYRTEGVELLNSPYFNNEFVGLGPYRLVRWEPGSHMEFTRFDDYFRGRPRLDGVIVRFVGDPTTMLANIVAGAVDVATPFLSANLDAVFDVRQRWSGTSNSVRIGPTDGVRHLQLQFRPQLSRPASGFTNPTVRQAFFHAIDRPGLIEVMTRGAAPLADSWIPPVGAMRPQVESAIPQYPYDPARARQLLAQTDWARGPDGALVHQSSGEHFEIEIWGRPGSSSEQELNIIADNWGALGATTKVSMVPTARVNDRELLATYPGVLLHNPTWETIFEDRIHSRSIASAADRWSGRNAAGYSNPRVDPLVDALLATIDPRTRIDLQRQLAQEAMTDVAFMPLYWVVRPVLVLGTVQGTVSAFATGWNIFDWDKEV